MLSQPSIGHDESLHQAGDLEKISMILDIEYHLMSIFVITKANAEPLTILRYLACNNLKIPPMHPATQQLLKSVSLSATGSIQE
jgi:hypothetical protein